MRAFVLSFEALATLFIAFGLLLAVIGMGHPGAGQLEQVSREMQVHDVAWLVESCEMDEKELAWVADELGTCMELQAGEGQKTFGRGCTSGVGEGEVVFARVLSYRQGAFAVQGVGFKYP